METQFRSSFHMVTTGQGKVREIQGQGKVREIQGQGKVREFRARSGKFKILRKVMEVQENPLKVREI